MQDTADARPGEEIDAASLSAYLRRELNVEGSLTIAQFPGGSSNLTYLVSCGGSEYVLRRPPFGNTVRTAHDMRREFDVLSKLSSVYPPAPKVFLFCDDPTIIGPEFYLMERRNGVILRGKSPNRLNASPELQREVVKGFVRNLVDLHSVDPEIAGLGSLGKPEGYPIRQVEGWTKRYFAAKTHEHRELESSFEWVSRHVPAESGAALIHNDYKFDNVMLDAEDLTRVAAVLDWEMVTLGDPLMDLGTTLGYWMSADSGEEFMRTQFNPRVLMETISRRELVDMYEKHLQRPLPNMLFYYVFGTIKIAVIAQQIYARYTRGLTSDLRFAGFNRLVGGLGRIAANAIERDTI